MNRRLHAILRRIEKSLDQIDTPKYEGMTISKGIKAKELENLVQKLVEARSLAEHDSDVEWIESVSMTLKNKVNELFNPKIGEVYPISPTTFSKI